jgi:hypothetical protein
VQAVSPYELNGTKYIFLNWSDGGDTTHNITVNAPLSLTAFYKVQFKLVMNSAIPFTFGGNQFYDSAASFQFGVTNRIVNYNGTRYTFKGWTGSGTGAYTSQDSSGMDSVRTIAISNPIVESPRWVSSTSVQTISSEIPNEFNLYQNYPNPFNPATNIRFDIVKSGVVKILIYDVLGREVANLLNENLTPGKYNITFNASNLASGIYYYKITTQDFTNIKKMLLIK